MTIFKILSLHHVVAIIFHAISSFLFAPDPFQSHHIFVGFRCVLLSPSFHLKKFTETYSLSGPAHLTAFFPIHILCSDHT